MLDEYDVTSRHIRALKQHLHLLFAFSTKNVKWENGPDQNSVQLLKSVITALG